MPKYALLHEAVEKASFPGLELCSSSPASTDQILLVHTQEYVEKVINGGLTDKEVRRIGFPWSLELVVRSFASVGGTIDACRAASLDGLAVNLAGGTHHAYPDHGAGYCVFNDVAVAARVMQRETGLKRILILDCDVHQGNGTAAIFAQDDSVFTFSVHGEKNFPFHKEQSDIDIALPDGSGDSDFLEAVYSGAEQAAERSRPELVIYIAGADPFAEDQLGRLKMTKHGLERRDRWVLDFCRKRGLPAAVVMGGGYAHQVSDVVDIHLQTIRIAAEIGFPPEFSIDMRDFSVGPS